MQPLSGRKHIGFCAIPLLLCTGGMEVYLPALPAAQLEWLLGKLSKQV